MQEQLRGFTLVEMLVVVGIVAILAGVSWPAYTAYVQRSRVPAALEALSTFAVRMEQRFQDVGSYANADDCGVSPPALDRFTVRCELRRGETSGGTVFTVIATGQGSMAGYGYSIDDAGTRRTTAHPRGLPAADCWSIRGAACDS